jgi:tyrosinase
VTRKNILQEDGVAAQYVEGVLALKDPARFPWPAVAGLSIYDFFVFWHARSMMTLTPPTQSDRNAAHSGPAFLPWHRYMLLRYEEYLRAALQDDEFRLPYWDWTADAERTDPVQSPLWSSDRLGRFLQSDFEVRIGMNAAGGLVRANRALRRSLGAAGALPRRPDVLAALQNPTYDSAEFNSDAPGFRNLLEGWIGPASIHNSVHVWIGGDMQLATSPNDPVFYLHHCNIDRIWSAWQARWPQSPYVPPADAPEELAFHRLRDALYTFLEETVTPEDMLQHDQFYTYDSLADLS